MKKLNLILFPCADPEIKRNSSIEKLNCRIDLQNLIRFYTSGLPL